ncbi:hypothetical protein C4K46_00535 [Streptococcus oricebi]|uniref:Lipoprotein n=1 Tax=Streptococcus oricebi TaxID=1547447 RepID=A0ABS5B0R6_9STRE|nr:hypothetical protein [Streptococcus oricebi]
MACSKAKTPDLPWLKGKWYSEDWKVTYQFSEKNGKWEVREQDNLISSETIVKSKSNKEFDLLISKGRVLRIQKITDTEIYLQKTVTQNEGTTQSVKFVKKN